ncbi:MAG: efflux RND transporter periplasmic adaptor subunit [Bacteroidales bacterium]|nr:efflux RND transporter periplasmic adaptor subunit [Bacteroidales bacterium]
MKIRQLIIIFSALGIITLGFVFMKFLSAQKPVKEPLNQKKIARTVKAEKIKYDVIHSSITATGRLAASSEIELVAQASGIILEQKIRLKSGESFSKGEILFEIDKEQQSLALKAQKSNFLNTLVNVLPDIKIDFNNHYTEFDNFLKNIELNKSLPEFPSITNQKLKIFLASRGVLAAYYSIKQQEVALSRHVVTAPFNGSFTQVTMEAGSYTNIGGRIAKIIKTDDLEMEVAVDNSNSKWLKKNQEIEIFSNSRNLKWTGTIVRISDFVNAQTQSRAVYIKVKNKTGQQLLSGEYLTANLGGITIKNSFEIPRNAVFNTNEVYIVVDGKLKIKTINILKINDKTLLFNGLENGDVIVTEPLINANENTEVSVLKEDK